MSNTLDCIFKPRALAIVGASRRKDKIGGVILQNLIRCGFRGKVFPVNPNTDVVQCLKSYPSVNDIPDEVDLAIITVGRKFILEAVEQCGRKGIKGLVIITAGFKEIGQEGQQLEAALLQKIREYGMRAIGPNCMGIIHTHPDIAMHASFGVSTPSYGKVAFMSQSGALGEVILAHTQRLGLGLSYFVSLGNKVDVSANDLLEYWKDDPNVQVILCYLENFGNPRKFSSLAREISKTKPILVVKSGRTRAGARAASSHTGALAGMDVAVDALFEQCGVIRVNGVDELFDVARFFSSQPVPGGNRLAVLTNAGGPAIMTTDAAVNMGLQMSPLTEATKKALKSHLPAEACVDNPVDMIASASLPQYRASLELLLADETVDAVIVIFVTPLITSATDVARGIAQAAASSTKPIMACFMNTDEGESLRILAQAGIPNFVFPDAAVRTLCAAVRYQRWSAKPLGEIRKFKVDTERARQIIKGVQQAGRTDLLDEEIRALLQIYGIPFARSKMAKTLEEVLEAAQQLGYPVVLKAKSRRIIHKTDLGGVVTDLRNEKELWDAYRQITERLHEHQEELELEGFILEEMVRHGKEVVMGMVSDPTFGPLIMFGMGGIYVEIVKDIQFRINPLSSQDAKDMIASIRSYPLLTGVRGEAPVDLEFLQECLQRLSQMVTELPALAQLDINPFIITNQSHTSKCVDARASIKPLRNKPS